MKPILVGIAGALAWTVMASAAYAWLGRVPLHSWFYYAIPWPDDFLWSGLFLILSAALPVILAVAIGRIIYSRYRPDASLFGKTGWANTADMQRGGIDRTKRL